MPFCRTCAAAQFNARHLNGCWAVLPIHRTPAEINIRPGTGCVNGKYVPIAAGKELADKVRVALGIGSIKGEIGG